VTIARQRYMPPIHLPRHPSIMQANSVPWDMRSRILAKTRTWSVRIRRKQSASGNESAIHGKVVHINLECPVDTGSHPAAHIVEGLAHETHL
jgi:hypothetical protein